MSLLPPESGIETLDGISPQRLKALKRLGISTLGDLIRHFPRRHENRCKFARFPDQASETPECLFGVVKKTSYRRFGPRRIFEAVIEDENGGLLSSPLVCRWFNMPWVQKSITGGCRMVVFGKPRLRSKQIVMEHPEYEVIEEDACASIHFDRIVPVHAAGDGIPVRALRDIIYQALKKTDLSAIPQLWPESTPSESMSQNIWRAIHFPESLEECERARQQIVREIFFGIQLRLAYRKAAFKGTSGVSRPGTGLLWGQIQRSLPFSVTPSQTEVMDEISRDMASPHRMNRLLQGDVGSGKTLVSLRAMVQAHESGFQAAMMAPTQILAEQHYRNFRRILDPLGIPLILHTSARTEATPDNADALPGLFESLPSPSGPPLVVGTHALLFEKARFDNLGLVVIDEQHKFGVIQRSRLISRADAPDVLVMTATPIPRTITQTLYGDLDVSIIRERPAGRGKIITAVRDVTKLPDIIQFLRTEIAAGRQAYVVYPLIEESEKLDAKAAAAEFEKWGAILAPSSVGLIHGRLDPATKEKVMDEFRAGKISVLVATTVIEVGVDVPNATIMLIEEAGRFGLAQMHQLRGRIGRGMLKSYCILLHDGAKDAALEKLQVMEKTDNGFEIAEADLRLRGPGELLGTAQTGIPSLGPGDLLRDAALMNEARSAALALIADDPGLSLPEHKNHLEFVQKEESRLAATTES